MKLTKTASGKHTIKISKSEWTNIGKKAGWMKDDYDDDDMPSKWELDADAFNDEAREEYNSQLESEKNKAEKSTQEGIQIINNINFNDTLLGIMAKLKAINQPFVNYFYNQLVDEGLFDIDFNNQEEVENSISYLKDDILPHLDNMADRFIEKEVEESGIDLESVKEQLSEAKEEARDPYGYRGLRRSDF